MKKGACIFHGFIKVCRKLNGNIAMDNFIKHYQPGINPLVFQRPPSKLTQHVSDTFIWGEFVFDQSSCPSLGHFNFIYVMLCVGGTLNLRANLCFVGQLFYLSVVGPNVSFYKTQGPICFGSC